MTDNSTDVNRRRQIVYNGIKRQLHALVLVR
jgi:hypothetical protein